MLLRACLPAPDLQASPCKPSVSMTSPHTQSCWRNNGRPILSPTAMRTSSSLSRSPRDWIGMAFSQSPECGARVAKNLARSRGETQPEKRDSRIQPTTTPSQARCLWDTGSISETEGVQSDQNAKQSSNAVSVNSEIRGTRHSARPKFPQPKPKRHYYFFHPQYSIPEGIRNYIKGGTLDSTSSVNSQDAAAKLLRYKIELNLWMVTEMRCRRCWVSLASPVHSVIRRPSSVRRASPRSLKGPKVSMIVGQKQDVVDNSAYFSIFFSDAISAAPPATVDESGRYDGATVLVIVIGLIPPFFFVNPHRILKKTYVKGKGGGNDPKTKIATTFFLLKIY